MKVQVHYMYVHCILNKRNCEINFYLKNNIILLFFREGGSVKQFL